MEPQHRIDKLPQLQGGNNALCVVTLDNVGLICIEHGVTAAQFAIQEFHRRMKEFEIADEHRLNLTDTRFYFYLSNLIDQNHLLLAALKIERLFEYPMQIEDVPVDLQVHAGLVFCPQAENGETISSAQLYGFAEQARQSAISNGQSFRVESTAELTNLETVSSLNTAFLNAIENHDLTLEYQPKYRLVDGALVGAEALVRWRRDGNNIVAPGEFIPFLSDSALWGLTRYCIRCVISDWPAINADIPFSVNIDPSCLNENLGKLIEEECGLWSFDPTSLMLEITESSVMMHYETSLDLLNSIRDLGVQISIDDFGTGYSSMHRFRDLPADEIKLDRSFILDIVEDSANQKITQTMIELCHRFSKTVVAEGIEDRGTYDYLVDAGCDIGQGFYLGRPMNKEQFALLDLHLIKPGSRR